MKVDNLINDGFDIGLKLDISETVSYAGVHTPAHQGTVHRIPNKTFERVAIH